MNTFGKRKVSTVKQELIAATVPAMRDAWRDAMDWTGPRAIATPIIRETVANVAAR